MKSARILATVYGLFARARGVRGDRMKVSRILAPFCGLLALGAAGIAGAGINGWTLTGPPSGPVQTLATHPTDPQVAIASTKRGLVRSTDSGESWTLLPYEPANEVLQLLFDPSTPNQLIAVDGGIHLSRDAGLTFQLAQGPEPLANVRRAAFAHDGTLYVVTYGGRAYRAVPPLSSWTELAHPWPADAALTAVTVDPANRQIVYVAVGDSGIYRSIDGGANWSGPLTTGFFGAPNAIIEQLIVSPANSAHVFAASSTGVHRSTDGGDTWSQVDPYPTSWIAFDPNNADYIYTARGRDRNSRSTNGGATFAIYGPELRVNGQPEVHFVAGSSTRLLYATEKGVALGEFFVGDLYHTYRATGIGGGYTSRVVMGTDGLVFVAQGSGFNDIFLRRNPDVVPYYLGSDGLFGLTVTTGPKQVTSLAVAPFNSNVLFAVNGANQLVRSYNRGETWEFPHPQFGAGSPTDYITDVQFGGSSQVAYVGRAEGGVWKTTNSGFSFNWLSSSPRYIGAIAVHPSHPQLIYVSGGPCNASGIYKSTDFGDNWTQVLAPTTACSGNITAYNGFAFDPVRQDTVYALAWGGVLKTVDGGAHWTPMDFGGPSGTQATASAMLIDPLYPDTMIMINGADQPGFLRTVDGGVTWVGTRFEIPGRESHLYRAVMTGPGHIVAGSNGSGVVEYTVAPDLSLQMTPTPDVLPLGTNYNATFTVTNHGPHASTASEITLIRPTWLTPAVPANCTASGQTLTCRLGVLQVGQSAQQPLTFNVAGQVNGSQLTAYVTGRETDAVSSNNRVDREVTAAELIDLDMTMSATPPVIDRGGVTEFVTEFINRGPGPATNTQLVFLDLEALYVEQIQSTHGVCQLYGMASCDFGTVPANTTVRVTVRMRGNNPGSFDITGILTAAGPDSDNDQNRVVQNILVRPVSDLAVTLSESSDPVDVDAPLQYVATVRNNGPGGSPAEGASRLDVAIAGATVRSATPSEGSCSTTSTSVSCTFSPPSVATVAIDLDTATPGITTAIATVTYPGTDPEPGNNTATIGSTIRRSGDVSVEIVDNADPVDLGQDFAYLVTVRNSGPNAGPVDLDIPVTHATIRGATSNTATCSHTAAAAHCTLAMLAPGAASAITVNIGGAQAAGIATATVTATFAGVDSNPANNSASAGTTLRRTGDVSVDIADSADPATAGIPFNYIVTARNSGPNAGPVQVVIPVTNATVLGVTSPGAACTNTATTATCDIASLASGGSHVITVSAAVAAPGNVSATATASFAGFDANSANNSATASTTVRLVGDVGVEIADSADPVVVDAAFDYVVTSRNTGPNASGVRVVIPVTNAVVTGVTSAGATCTRTANSATCDIASLASGASNEIRVTVAASAAGVVGATATATFAGFDSNAANDSATASTTVRRVGDVSVTVADSVDPATAGVAYNYTVMVRNGGPNAGAVNLSVPVTGATVASTALAGGTCTHTSSSVSCDIASLASNATATLTINVSAATAGAASAAATAVFSGTDPDAANNTATASTVVGAPPVTTPPTAPPTPPRSGGGGGGRFDWLALFLLGGLLAFNRFRAPAGARASGVSRA